uniref:Hemolymph proteinase 20 n=1 Tax=Manduca sexta TaxID=7130 RepID=Q5MPB4_MANSE|nr:hemolymph proteinase 20 [Manduca sexta]
MFVQYILCVCFATTVFAGRRGGRGGKGETDRLDHFVSGGFKEEMRMSPWHAGIYTKSTTPYMQICGGTLIAKNVVVSAAHCFSESRQKPSVANYAVAVGKIYRPWNDAHDTGAQKSDVKEIIIPPRYQGNVANFQDDIALVIVEKEFHNSEFVKPACVSFDERLDEEQLWVGNTGKVAGWGLTGEDARPSQVLRAAILPSVTIDKCIDESPVAFRSYITGDKICAGYNNGTAVCRGDSGGGLMFSSKIDGVDRFFLRGIVSTSNTAEEHGCNIYTWATFTHLLRHEHLVKAVVPDVEEACSPKSSDEGVDDRIARLTDIPRIQRCDCTCPPGTYKIRHGKYCKNL